MAIPISDIYVRLGEQNAVTEIKFVQGGWLSTGSLADIEAIDPTRVHDKQIAYSTEEGKFYIATKTEQSTAFSPGPPPGVVVTPASLDWEVLPVGFPYTGSAGISGSLVVNGPVSASLFSGSFYGDGSNLTGIDTFPYTGSAEITGSLGVTGSLGLLSEGQQYYLSGSSNTLRIGSKATANKIQLELHHNLNPVSLGIAYSGGSALPYIESVHPSYDTNTHLLFKPGGTENWRIGAHGSNHTYASAFAIKPASDSHDFYLANSSGDAILYSDTGNQSIGIGTDTPTTKLDIHGDALITGSLVVQGSVTAEEFHTEFVSASIVYQSGSTKFGDTSDDMHSFTGSIALQVSESSKGMAIETATGIQVGKLYNGNSNTFPVGTLALSYGSNGSAGMLTGQSNGLKIRGGYNSGGKIIFTSVNDEIMRMDSTGLGIGTTAPTEKLTVSGSISASGDFYLDGALYDVNNEAGTVGQILQSTETGVDWVDPTGISVQAEQVFTQVKNVSGGTLTKGTPVHAVSSSSSGNINPIIAASASDASSMPATFILNEDLVDEAEGLAISIGSISGVDTSAFEVGDIVYVGENGGFTNVKPQGSDNLIQNLGVVTKVHASNGRGFVYGSGRSNDVPNLPTGKIWVGSDSYSVTSSLVHLDEDNGRMGIGTDTPNTTLVVHGNSVAIQDGTKGIHVGKSYGDFGIFGASQTGSHYNPDRITLSAGNRNPNNSAYIDIYSRYGSDADKRGDIHLVAGASATPLTSGSIRMNTGGWVRAIIDYDGNMGVGIAPSTTSRGRLIVKGDFQDNLSGNGQLAVIGGVSGSNASGSGNGGQIVLGGSISTSDSTRTFASIGGHKENDTSGDRAGYLSFGTRQNQSPKDIFERMRITSTGNVGIGLTTPSDKLTVAGNIVTSGSNGDVFRIGLRGSDPTNLVGGMRIEKVANYGSYVKIHAGRNWGGWHEVFGIQMQAVDDIVAYPSQSQHIRFNAKDVGPYQDAVLYVDSGSGGSRPSLHTVHGAAFAIESGSVGIGTDTPASMLEVKAPATNSGTEVKITNNFGESPKMLSFDYENISNGINYTVGQISTYGRPTTVGGPYMQFKVHDGTTLNEVIRISGSGNVGIGTTAPTSRLHVVPGYSSDIVPGVKISQGWGSLTQYLVDVESTSDGQLLKLTSGASRADSKLFSIVNSTSEVFTVKGNGRVGIGTTAPTATLHVSGTLRVEDRLQLPLYGEGLLLGTDVTYTLGVDQNGNVVEVPQNSGQNTDVDTGTEVVDSFASGSFNAAFTNYYVKQGTNLRAGQLMSVWDSSGNVEYTDVSTNSLGDTSGVLMFATMNGGTVEIKTTVDTNNWTVKVNTTLL